MSDDPLDKEISFADGIRGKFYRPDARIHIAVPVDLEVHSAFNEIAVRKGVEVSELINDVLKKELAIAEVLR